jgi:Spy/CpxP family protein refolding chaperone
MKISFLSLFLVGALMGLPQQMTLAQDSSTTGQTTPATGSTGGTGTCTPGQGQRLEKLKAALAQLNLTDAQKEQIKQIRSTVTDRKERRQEIMAVLTPDQKARLIAMIQAHRNGSQGATSTASTGSEDQ